MVLLAMLDRVRAPDGEPQCLLKGGVAMELRFDLGARATKDSTSPCAPPLAAWWRSSTRLSATPSFPV
jgi:hypothetical protein